MYHNIQKQLIVNDKSLEYGKHMVKGSKKPQVKTYPFNLSILSCTGAATTATPLSPNVYDSQLPKTHIMFIICMQYPLQQKPAGNILVEHLYAPYLSAV